MKPRSRADERLDDFLLKTRDVSVLQRPSNRDYDSLLNFFDRIKPIIATEAQWIHCREDIVTLRQGRESTSFDEFIETSIKRVDHLLTQWLRCKILKVCLIEGNQCWFTDSSAAPFHDAGAAPEDVKGLGAVLLARANERPSQQPHRRGGPDPASHSSDGNVEAIHHQRKSKALRSHWHSDRVHNAVRLRNVLPHGSTPARDLCRICGLLRRAGRLH